MANTPDVVPQGNAPQPAAPTSGGGDNNSDGNDELAYYVREGYNSPAEHHGRKLFPHPTLPQPPDLHIPEDRKLPNGSHTGSDTLTEIQTIAYERDIHSLEDQSSNVAIDKGNYEASDKGKELPPSPPLGGVALSRLISASSRKQNDTPTNRDNPPYMYRHTSNSKCKEYPFCSCCVYIRPRADRPEGTVRADDRSEDKDLYLYINTESNSPEDRSNRVAIDRNKYGAIVRNELRHIRNLWQSEDDSRRKAHRKALETVPWAQMAEHSMGNLRTLIHDEVVKKIVEVAHETAGMQSNDEAKELAANMETKDVDIHVFRVTPWVFQIGLAADQAPTYRDLLNRISSLINRELNLCNHEEYRIQWQANAKRARPGSEGAADHIAKSMATTKDEGEGTKESEEDTGKKRKN